MAPLSSVLHRLLLRDLLIVLAIKLILIMLAAHFLFGARQRPVIDADMVIRHVFRP